MKKIISLLLVLCLSFGLAVTANADQGEKVIVAIGADPQNIGPFQGMSLGRIGVLYTTYEMLCVTVGGEIQPVLMKDYEQVDELTYNVNLYDYIYDQAGNHLTAEDVKWCYDTAKEMGNLPKLTAIESVEVTGDYSLQFKFTTLAIGDLGALWMECPIVTRAAYEASPDGMAIDPVSTTAYKLTEYVSGSKFVYEYTGNYWQTDERLVNPYGKHNVNTIEFDVIADSTQLANALKTRAIDVTVQLTDTDVEDFVGQDGFTVSSVPDNLIMFLSFNCDETQGMFYNNPDARKAIAYAIDANMIAQGAYNGNAKVLTAWGHDKYSDYVADWANNEYYSYDLAKAQELAKSSGLEGKTVRLLVVNLEQQTRVATIIQAFLSQIGVTCTIEQYDSQLFGTYKYETDKYDIVLDTLGSTAYLVNVWATAFDEANYTHGGTFNFVHDDQLQALLDEATATDGHTAEQMDAFNAYMAEQLYSYALVEPMVNIAHTDTIKTLLTDCRIQINAGGSEY